MPGRCNSQICLLEGLTSDHNNNSLLLLPRFSMEVLIILFYIYNMNVNFSPIFSIASVFLWALPSSGKESRGVCSSKEYI